MRILIDSYINELKTTLDKIDRQIIIKIYDLLKTTSIEKKQVFIFGNGGSGSTASHFVCDLNKGASYQREFRYRGICLNDNTPTISAYSNDVSYDDVFVEQLKNFLNEGDIVIGISGSGNSKNVIKAIDFANRNGNITVGLTGFDGGLLKEKAKYNINAPVLDMQIAEDVHLVVVHILLKAFNSSPLL
jgi:D-sedoheptulose 7-phosphate isomerase